MKRVQNIVNKGRSDLFFCIISCSRDGDGALLCVALISVLICLNCSGKMGNRKRNEIKTDYCISWLLIFN